MSHLRTKALSQLASPYAASSAGIRLLAIALIFLLFTTFFIYSILHYEDGSHKIGRTERSAFSINGHLIRWTFLIELFNIFD